MSWSRRPRLMKSWSRWRKSSVTLRNFERGYLSKTKSLHSNLRTNKIKYLRTQKSLKGSMRECKKSSVEKSRNSKRWQKNCNRRKPRSWKRLAKTERRAIVCLRSRRKRDDITRGLRFRSTRSNARSKKQTSARSTFERMCSSPCS